MKYAMVELVTTTQLPRPVNIEVLHLSTQIARIRQRLRYFYGVYLAKVIITFSNALCQIYSTLFPEG